MLARLHAHVLLNNPGNARHAHQRAMDELEWEDDDEAFEAWCEGRTGFPVVDAGCASSPPAAGSTTALG